jgi:hypothetical protein
MIVKMSLGCYVLRVARSELQNDRDSKTRDADPATRNAHPVTRTP